MYLTGLSKKYFLKKKYISFNLTCFEKKLKLFYYQEVIEYIDAMRNDCNILNEDLNICKKLESELVADFLEKQNSHGNKIEKIHEKIKELIDHEKKIKTEVNTSIDIFLKNVNFLLI